MVDREEQYVLRVQDKAVAARIRKQLNMDNSKAKLDARFDGASTGPSTSWLARLCKKDFISMTPAVSCKVNVVFVYSFA